MSKWMRQTLTRVHSGTKQSAECGTKSTPKKKRQEQPGVCKKKNVLKMMQNTVWLKLEDDVLSNDAERHQNKH